MQRRKFPASRSETRVRIRPETVSRHRNSGTSGKNMLTKILIRISAGLLLLSGGLYWMYAYGLKEPLSVPEEGFEYTVRSGMGLSRVVEELTKQEILNFPQALSLRLSARWKSKAHLIKAGEYRIPSGSNAMQLLDMLVKGKAMQHALALPEGWTFRRIMDTVNAHPKLTHTLNGLDNAAIMAKLGWPDIHPEGRFFPDTYYLIADTADVALLQQAYRKMQQELEAAWENRAENLPFKTPYQALILASIIQKEAGSTDEMAFIAGVFVNRLRKRMRLQADPTTIYGIGPKFNGNLRRADLRRDTPYNTYTRNGLPPTPIAMPSQAALTAALNPAVGKDLYFVAKGDGSHYFSASLREHECAIIKYQLKNKAPRQFARRCRAKPGCPACKRR
ncbi:MAG: endolytic transglycosylase MltG [Gammaproteobacteria bacterium]|nr:endolytic transglycosylase MltG [Gammaproteobacteria bacterium]